MSYETSRLLRSDDIPSNPIRFCYTGKIIENFSKLLILLNISFFLKFQILYFQLAINLSVNFKSQNSQRSNKMFHF